MLKILGASFIIISGIMFGKYMSQKEIIRMKQLNCIKKALLMLKSQIDYSCETLPEALFIISNRSDNPIKYLFNKISERLKQKQSESINDVWIDEFKSYFKNTNLSKEDLQAVLGLGKALGYLDKQLQLNNIDIVVDYIDRTVELIANKNEKESKMYQSLGILGGLLLALLLL